MAGKYRITGVSILCYFVLLLNSADAQVTIITQPRNVTVCLSQTANFTCVVNAGSTGITSVGWQIMIGNGYATVLGRDRHMVDVRTSVVNTDTIITETLTVTDVSLSDNGTKYRCQPFTDVTSDVVTLTVVGEPPSTVSNTRDDEKCITCVTVSWNPSTSNLVCDPLNYTVFLSPNVNQGPFITSDTSINLTDLAINNFVVIIRPTNMAGSGSNSSQLTITLPNIADTMPGGVTNLTNTSITSSEAVIAWNAAAPNMYCGPILYYTIFITNENTDLAKNSTALTTTITELMSNTTYNITVVAFNRIIGGMPNTIFITTVATGSSEPDNGSGGGLSGGAIAGIVIGTIIGIILIILIIFAAIYFLKRYKRDQNGILTNSSPDPSSPNKKKVTSKEPKEKTTKPSKQKDKQANKTEYAELQLSSTGTAPSVDPTKVDYTAVKEHEPLSYAEVQHDKRAGEKPIQGAPQVEYKEVWHQ